MKRCGEEGVCFRERSFFAALPAIVLALVIASCGGGGGGDSSNDNTPPPSSAKAWGTAELIETDDAGGANGPQIAFGGVGNALAVWQQWDGTRHNIWANHFDGTAWSMAELIETDNDGHAQYPQIAMDDSGKGIAVWYQYDSVGYNIRANHFDGTAWATPALILTNVGDTSNPQITMNGSGNAVAVWEQSNVARDDIWANGFNGTAWGTAELIDTDDAGSASYPQIAMNGSGEAIAVWYQDDGSGGLYSILANHFNGTSWGTAELIETDDAGSASYPQIAMDGSGKAIAVWYQHDSGGLYSILANHFNGTAWGTAMPIETNITDHAFSPQIAMNDSGNAIAVWEQSDGTRYNIWVNYFDGTSWGTAELIETDNADDAQNPQIALDDSGNAIAVWHQSDGTRYNIWANYFDGTSWGTAELIEIDNAGDATNPQIAFDGAGNAIAVWEQSDGTRYNIWANRFE